MALLLIQSGASVAVVDCLGKAADGGPWLVVACCSASASLFLPTRQQQCLRC